MPVQINLLEEKEIEIKESIPGFSYIPRFISAKEEEDLVRIIYQQPWLNDLKRRVQHYGWKYDYQARQIDPSMKLGDLPSWLLDYCEKLKARGIFLKSPDQVIINEYKPGQGISPHIDCVHCFSETIASLSLGSSCVMEFANPQNLEKIPIILEPCSLVVLSGVARYEWQHSIPSRKTDSFKGQKINRGRRISLTFRNVILKHH